jgi:AcrR family transcriptional regulator
MSAVAVLNKHQQKSEATRRKLLASAKRIFAKTGFEAARIEDIAADAGYTRGAFYANFESKESLFLALLEEQASQHVREFMEQIKAYEHDAEKMAAGRRYFLQRASDRQWSMLLLEFKLFAVRHPRLRAKLAKAHREIRAAVKAQIDPLFTRIGKASAEPTRAAMESILSGLVLQHVYDPDLLPEDQLHAILGDVFDLLTQRC